MCMRSDVQSTNKQCNQLANVLPTVPKGVVKVTKIGNGREVEEEMFYSYWQKKYLSRYEGTMRKRIIPERPKDLSKNRLVHDPTPSLLITVLR